MPRDARRTRPWVISVSMIARVVPLIGTARPRPTPATAVLTPTMRPVLSARTPPAGVEGGVGLDDLVDDAPGAGGQ